MKLSFKLISKWPKLAWVACIAQGSDNITVMHGPYVEIGKNWCAEAVWVGDFAKGNLDRTDLIFGSGIRCRDEKAIFVSSGTILDRLFYCKMEGSWYVSNSLPALLASSKISLKTDYLKYSDDIISIYKGLKKCPKVLPAKPTNINLNIFHNLVYDGKSFKETVKPDSAPSFLTYKDYFKFLIKSANSLRNNFSDPLRQHKIFPLASISSGYDSSAAAVIAKHAGCEEAVTIDNATSNLNQSDSGIQIANSLDIKCKIYKKISDHYNNEITFWAAAGDDLDLNLSIFDYHKPLCIFFTGFIGDTIWGKKPPRNACELEFHEPAAGIGFSEFRIHKGIFHCAVPYWGLRHAKEILDITISEEMKKWSLMNDYDRPIPRRIVEGANVPRGTFAIRKALTANPRNGFYWPHSEKEDISFRRYLKDLRIKATPPLIVKFYRLLALSGMTVKKFTGIKIFDPRLWLGRFKSKTNSLVFQWANTELKKRYEEGLSHTSI